jgi:hypothetical protein
MVESEAAPKGFMAGVLMGVPAIEDLTGVPMGDTMTVTSRSSALRIELVRLLSEKMTHAGVAR